MLGLHGMCRVHWSFARVVSGFCKLPHLYCVHLGIGFPGVHTVCFSLVVGRTLVARLCLQALHQVCALMPELTMRSTSGGMTALRIPGFLGLELK